VSKRVVAAHYFEANLCGDLIRPGDPDYDEARTVWNGMIDRYPALIACPVTVENVVAAVNFARENNILLAVRGRSTTQPTCSA
jgi:FAD/FMN-containing dehydrogenase